MICGQRSGLIMLTVKYTTKFKKDLERVKKRGVDLKKLQVVVGKLANRESLEERHRDHPLTGNYVGYRECHITPDWLLIYKIDNAELVLVLTRTGSHSDLFR